MTVNTGRTTQLFTTFKLDNAAGVLTTLSGVNALPEIGLDSTHIDLTALADPVHGGLPEIPSFTKTFTGVWNSVDHATLTGVDRGMTPLSLDILVGIRHAWELGEPHFGLTSTATAGVLVHNYKTDFITYSFDVYMFAGSTAPAWSTGAAYA
jgi:hypothetical protein